MRVVGTLLSLHRGPREPEELSPRNKPTHPSTSLLHRPVDEGRHDALDFGLQLRTRFDHVEAKGHGDVHQLDF